MLWYVIATAAFAAVIGIIIYIYISDRRYLRAKTSETMGPELKGEIEEERSEAIARRDEFRRILRAEMSRDDQSSP